MYENLPKNQKTFDIDMVGKTTGHHYKGQFTVKCVLDMAGIHQLELEKTRLRADYANPSQGLVGISVTLATIRAKAISTPDWWVNSDFGSKIIDQDVILAIFDKCEQAEIDWKKSIKSKADEAQDILDKVKNQEEADEQLPGETQAQ